MIAGLLTTMISFALLPTTWTISVAVQHLAPDVTADPVVKRYLAQFGEDA